MKFEPLYYEGRLRVVNPEGDVGVVTLWSKVDSAIQVMLEAGVDLCEQTSRVAIVANLYGNGLQQMLRNLLWNPQIQHILILGKNLSGSQESLVNFFAYGLEEVEFLGAKAFQIRNTTRKIDGELQADRFKSVPKFSVLGDLGSSETKDGLVKYFQNLLTRFQGEMVRIEPPPIPEPVITRFPSEVRSQTIVRRTPMEAWSELIFRLYRFGHRNKVTKRTGEETRIELLNTHVVVEEPFEETEKCLSEYGFSLEKFREYQDRFLDSQKPSDLDYTYGNRLRGHFHRGDVIVDSPLIVADRLRESPDSRHCYIALWDNRLDLPEGTKCPCFVSAFFRHFDGKLNLTANFRTHNAMDAWPENLYGLMALQRFVAGHASMQVGPITVISHSISIDPIALEKAKGVVENKKTDEVMDPSIGKYGPRMDPNGEFTVTLDTISFEIVVEHSYGGMKIGEYRGKTSEEIERQLARDVALSQISHALYLGRELARKQIQLDAIRAKKLL
ncbi:MAG: thymidylate synthase [Candidatus Paceibacterota bacterium]|jgi:thymidylate synthase